MKAVLLLALIITGCANMTDQQRTDALSTAEHLIVLAAEIGARYADPTDQGVGAQ
jgi:hypothetical protein